MTDDVPRRAGDPEAPQGAQPPSHGQGGQPPPPADRPRWQSSVDPRNNPSERRFSRGAIAGGVALGIALSVALPLLANAVEAALGLPYAGVLAFGLIPVGAGVALGLARTPGSRGLALGVLIGWALTIVLGVAACFAAIAVYTAS